MYFINFGISEGDKEKFTMVQFMADGLIIQAKTDSFFPGLVNLNSRLIRSRIFNLPKDNNICTKPLRGSLPD